MCSATAPHAQALMEAHVECTHPEDVCLSSWVKQKYILFLNMYLLFIIFYKIYSLFSW